MSNLTEVILSRFRTRQYIAIAGQAFLMYDYILTFPLEVDYIWKGPWRTVKVIFLLNRYGNLIGQSVFTLEEIGLLGSDKFCVAFPWFIAYFVIIAQESIHILVLLRAWAIWGCKHHTAIALIALYVCYLSACVGLLTYILVVPTHDTVRFIYLEAIGGFCIWQRVSNQSVRWILLVISFSLDSMVFIMVAFTLGKLFKQTQGFRRSPVLRALAMDASLFFVTNIIIVGITILCQTVFANDPRAILMIAFIPLLAVTGQRVVLNLRRLTPRHRIEQAVYRSEDREITTTRCIPIWQSVKHWMTSQLQDPEPEQNPESGEVDTASAFELLVMEGPEASDPPDPRLETRWY